MPTGLAAILPEPTNLPSLAAKPDRDLDRPLIKQLWNPHPGARAVPLRSPHPMPRPSARVPINQGRPSPFACPAPGLPAAPAATPPAGDLPTGLAASRKRPPDDNAGSLPSGTPPKPPRMTDTPTSPATARHPSAAGRAPSGRSSRRRNLLRVPGSNRPPSRPATSVSG